jgi:hypothetical protein
MEMTLTPTQPPELVSLLDIEISSLVFDNRTDFDALQFVTIDQHDQPFHVIVAKMGYSLAACNAQGDAQLVALDEPAKLNVEDLYYQDNLQGSVREESDLAPYKPLCDIIVNGQAYAPHGKAVRDFEVRLHVQRPDESAPLPERPQSLNPYQSLGMAQAQQWKSQRTVAQNTRIAGEVLVDKTLRITGERQLRKKFWFIRWFQTLLSWCTLGWYRPSTWRLTRAKAFTQLPLRYEHALGGQCRIEQGDKAADRVAKKHRLTPDEAAQHPNQDAPPIAHDACETNPVGSGFARRWYLQATRLKRLAAPRIEWPSSPFTAQQFWRSAQGGALPEPAGLGIIGRAYLPRRNLIGTIEVKRQYAQDEFPRLPKEFSYQYWNSAPVDQQCTHLEGKERISLLNLCPPEASYAALDASGNTLLRFSLPRQTLYLLAAMQDGKIGVEKLAIDTVVVDLDAAQVHLTWRICLPADASVLEARLMHATQEAQLQRIAQLQTPPTTVQDPAPARPSEQAAATT